MQKLLSVFLIVASFLVLVPVAHALPYFTYGDNSLYYINREVVFRYDDSTDQYVQLDYSDPNNLPTLEVGDIFVGILNVQTIDDPATGGPHWYGSATDQLSGIFAQEITAITPLTNGPTLTLKLDLGVAPTDTFTTLDNYTFSTGLSGNEVMRLYADDSTPFNSNGTIVEDIADATDGTEWLTLGMVEPTDYAYTYITPQGTALDDFVGKSWLGFSVMDFIYPSTIFPGVTDPEVGILVDFYANSELEGYDNFINGQSPWVFASNDPAYTNAVPEPATMLLLGSGLLGMVGLRRKKKLG